MTRITIAHLEAIVNRLNTVTHNPPIPRTKDTSGKLTANVGNYHLYQAYGAVGLHQMMNESGGVHEIIGLCSKRELSQRLHVFLNGIEAGKQMSKATK